jgi:NitT/TauT family transport system permease protein
LGAWEIGERAGVINSLLFSSPSDAFSAGVTAFRDDDLLSDVLLSLLELGLGLALSIALGVAVGIGAGRSRIAYQLVNPWLTILYAVPFVAIVPLLVIALGYGVTAKVVVITLFATFPVAINTLKGVHATSRHFTDVARSFSASRRKTLVSVVVPGAMPYIIGGSRLAGGQALVGLVVAEFMAGGVGIGYRLNAAGQTFNTGLLIFILMLLGLTGVGYSVLMRRIEGRVSAWQVA